MPGPAKRGRKPGRPDKVRLTYLLGWYPCDGRPKTGRPRTSTITDRDLVLAVRELTQKELSQDQALLFLANYEVADRLACEIERTEGLGVIAAWEAASDRLSHDPPNWAKEVNAALTRLRKRLPDARNRFS